MELQCLVKIFSVKEEMKAKRKNKKEKRSCVFFLHPVLFFFLHFIAECPGDLPDFHTLSIFCQYRLSERAKDVVFASDVTKNGQKQKSVCIARHQQRKKPNRQTDRQDFQTATQPSP